MKAKVTKAFPGRPDDGAHTKNFVVGDIVEGDLARVAVANKWAEPVRDASKDDAKMAVGKKKG